MFTNTRANPKFILPGKILLGFPGLSVKKIDLIKKHRFSRYTFAFSCLHVFNKSRTTKRLYIFSLHVLKVYRYLFMRYVKRLILRYLDKFEHKKIKTRIDFIALLCK